ncbi:MAG: thioredoxin family protein [Dolichospermum sp.]|jgi:peroxiredoxin|nr:thioredoxin family protein [Anabaena sp. 49628_E55]
MALTPSTMLPLGTLAPDFYLPDVLSGQTISLANFADKKVLVVIFLSRHCPFVQHIKFQLAKLGQDYKNKNVGIVAISSNDINTHPDDAPELLKDFAQEIDLSYPLLYDESQKVAKDFFAACTPDFFVFNANRKLAYRGQLDNSRPKNGLPVTGQDLRKAINYVLADEQITWEQKPSIGCNIKWKSGNEPVYYQVPVTVG